MTGARRPAVFLDRDGVINDVVLDDGGVARGPATVADLVVAADAADAVALLRDAGFVLVVVTNQPDVERGWVRADDVEAIHAELGRQLGLDAFYWCPHGGKEPCACRKPAPGMLLDAARDLALDLAASWLIGDRWVDLAAGRAAGVRPVLLERPWSWSPTSSGNLALTWHPSMLVVRSRSPRSS